MPKSATISFLAALTLTACQQSEQTTVAPSDASAAPVAPSKSTPVPSTPTANAIPERFRGVWDDAKGGCAAASELRLEIGAVSIQFYESLGAVTAVTIESPNAILVDLAMEGEGERWEVGNRYVLSDDGATLTPVAVSQERGPAIPRKKCPA